MDSDSDDTLDIIEEALGKLSTSNAANGAEDDNVETEESGEEESAADNERRIKEQRLEEWLNRWGRAAGINEADALGPIRDEVTAWMRMQRRPPEPQKFERYTDREDNFQDALHHCDGGLYVPTPEDKKDFEFYQRWSETLQFRWNYDFASLELRRAKRGWKWRLVRIRPSESYVLVEPFIKPSQRPFRERGKLSNEFMKPRTDSSRMFDKIREQADLRFIGVPVTRAEQEADEWEVYKIRIVESIRDHYGFVGDAVCNAAAETNSSVYLLLILLSGLWMLVFAFGPPSLQAPLSEFLVGLLPLQSSLKGILAVATEWHMRNLEKELLEDLPQPEVLGGNVRQWLLYWPFYQISVMLLGWIQVIRPGWYHLACGCRTGCLLVLGSPLFGSNAIHEPDKKAQRRRLLIRVWAKRGQRLVDEVVLRPEVKRLRSAQGVTKSSPLQGMPVGGKTIDQILLDARLLLGFYEDYYKGSINSGSRQISRIRSTFEGLRTAVIEVERELQKATKLSNEQEKSKALASLRDRIRKPLYRAYAMTRTTDGARAFADMLKHRYGASQEEIAEFMNARAYEMGIVGSNMEGQAAARSYKGSVGGIKAEGGKYTGEKSVRGLWRRNLEEVFVTPELVAQAQKEIVPPWEAGYIHRPYSINMPDMTSDFIAMQRGDLAARGRLTDPQFQRTWNARLNQLGLKQPSKRYLPWENEYKHSTLEDFTEMKPPTGSGGRAGRERWRARDFFEQRPTPDSGYIPDGVWPDTT